MRKLTKKISMLMVLAMLVGLFSGVVSASAASKWSFKSNDIDAAVGATVNLDQDQYENFDLYKNGAIADEATYTITWESSDEDVVWVNAKSGQLRAKKDAADGAEAVITANIVNNGTKKTHAVSFTIVVGEVKAPVFTVEHADITANLGDEIKFAPDVKNEAGEVVKFATHKSYNGYFLDGKAITNPWTPEEAGEYTVTVAQFAAKADVADLAKAVRKIDVKVAVVDAKAFEVKQVDMTTVNVTFGTEAAADAFVKGWDGKLAVNYVLKDSDLVIDDIASVKEVKLSADKKVAQIVMFGNFITDATYTFAYDGKEATIVGTGVVPASIVVVEKSYPRETTGTLYIDVYNKDGVKINGGYDTGLYTVSWKAVDGDDSKFDLTDNTIIFYEKDAKAVVEATLEMGFDANDEELADLTDKGTVIATAEYADAKIKEFQFDGDNSWVAAGGTLNLFVKNQINARELKAKFTRTNYGEWGVSGTTDYAILNGTATNVNDAGDVLTEAFSYTSSNPSIAMVDSTTGMVTANSAGVATVFVKNSAGNTVGSVKINVIANQQLTNFSISPKNNKLSVGTELTHDDSFLLEINAKDQIGGNMFDDVILSYTLSDGTDAEDYFNFAYAGWGNNIKVTAYADVATLVPDSVGNAGAGKTKSYRITVKATDNGNGAISFSRPFSFTVKDVDADKLASIELDMKTSVDMKAIQGWNDGVSSTSSYDVDIKAVKKDNNGYFLGYQDIDEIVFSNKKSDVATGGAFTVFVNENGQKVNEGYDDERFEIVTATEGYDYVKFSTVVKNGDAIARFNTWGGSNFGVRLYEGLDDSLKSWDYESLSVKDSSEKGYAVQQKNVIVIGNGADEIATADLLNAVKLYYAGKELAGWTLKDNSAVVAEYNNVGDTVQVFISSVTVNAKIKSYNGKFEDNVYETITIDVNKLFTIAD